jgi:magnesium-transporting ATPase (P-type)
MAKRLNAITRFRIRLRRPSLRGARRFVVGALGGTVILLGIVMIALPGPAILVFPLGLAILATEFLWAKRWLKRLRAMLPHRRRMPSSRAPAADTAWHQLSAEDALDRLDAKATGLSGAEAARRLATNGPNEIQEGARIGPLRILLGQFKQTERRHPSNARRETSRLRQRRARCAVEALHPPLLPHRSPPPDG